MPESADGYGTTRIKEGSLGGHRGYSLVSAGGHRHIRLAVNEMKKAQRDQTDEPER